MKNYFIIFLWLCYAAVLIMALSFAIALFIARSAYGYPQNIRHGYSTCLQCHILPSGGGILTNYGRSVSDELTTFAFEGEGRLLSSIDQPDWLVVGGDIRWINFTSKSALAERSNIMWMQTDLELAVSPIPRLWLVGTVGKYNEGDKYEQRRNYLLLNVSDQFSFRVGKFFPSLGLNLPDHRAFIHPGQGRETYNAEATYTGSFIQATATAFGSSSHTIKATDKRGYTINEKPGHAFSLAFNILSSKLGAFISNRQGLLTRGVFASVGMGPYYLLQQYQFHIGEKINYTEAGYEIIKGLDFFTRYQCKPGTKTYAAGLNWLPRPHWQLLTEIQREVIGDIYLDSLLILGHYNL